ncbi:MAG: hypothetical protein OEV74_01030 [Cyclobacteriaceae bacterium]|nr:hypothetical protein [Cyclobacteriaceae bacterium]MDH4294832.1 hypothetical protein [Cyclobacteriaceae bacterium]MDH5248114.1 hypothetical protein [Cyclobacteriaceae bacterium]
MKKLFSILFLLIFLFNIGGYYLVFWGVRSQAKKDLLHRLDADEYSSKDLIVLTIPISLPYPIHQDGYERVDGEFEYQGEYFNLVKQRLENDTLFMVCIKDRHEKNLVEAFNEYASLANDLPSGAKHTMDLFGKLFKDYSTTAFATSASGKGWCQLIPCITEQFPLIQKNYPIHTPPPKV